MEVYRSPETITVNEERYPWWYGGPTFSYDATILVNRSGKYHTVPEGKQLGLVPLADLTDEEMVGYHLGVFLDEDIECWDAFVEESDSACTLEVN